MAARILIADDHEIMRTALKTALQDHDDWHVCAEASNGVEAVKKTAECHPDVVIVDLSMPEMNGLEAAAKIHSSSPDTPVLLYTVYRFPTLEIDAKQFGVRQVVDKCGSVDQLMWAVEDALSSGPPQTRNAGIGGGT